MRYRFGPAEAATKADEGHLIKVRAPLFTFILAEELTRPFLPGYVKSLLVPIPGISPEIVVGLPIVLFMLIVAIGQPAAQIKAISAYRPFQTLGVLYTPTEQNSVVVLAEIRKLGRANGFDTVSRTFRLDANRKVTADGAAELVRELKEAKAQWLYLPPDSFLGTLAQDVIIPTAMEVGLPTFASTEQLMQAGALSGLVSRY